MTALRRVGRPEIHNIPWIGQALTGGAGLYTSPAQADGHYSPYFDIPLYDVLIASTTATQNFGPLMFNPASSIVSGTLINNRLGRKIWQRALTVDMDIRWMPAEGEGVNVPGPARKGVRVMILQCRDRRIFADTDNFKLPRVYQVLENVPAVAVDTSIDPLIAQYTSRHPVMDNTGAVQLEARTRRFSVLFDRVVMFQTNPTNTADPDDPSFKTPKGRRLRVTLRNIRQTFVGDTTFGKDELPIIMYVFSNLNPGVSPNWNERFQCALRCENYFTS